MQVETPRNKEGELLFTSEGLLASERGLRCCLGGAGLAVIPRLISKNGDDNWVFLVSVRTRDRSHPVRSWAPARWLVWPEQGFLHGCHGD